MVRGLGMLLVGAIVGVVASWAYLGGNRSRPTLAIGPPGQPLVDKRSVFAIGTLEPRGGAVLVTSSLVGTHIREVHVREGQVVEPQQLLVTLDSTVAEEEFRIAQSQREAALEKQQTDIALARQRLEAAELALEQAKSVRALELESQQKQIEVTQAKLEQTDGDLRRLQTLQKGERPIVSAQQVEQQKTLVKLAKAEREAASMGLDRLEQTLRFNLQKAETEKKAAEESAAIASRGTAVATLDRQIKLAEHKLAQTQVTSPSAGTVISLLVHSGELVSTQPLMQIANLEALECQAEVDVADLSLIKEKRDAFISCRAFRGTKIKASIERIRSVAGAATLRPVDPRKSVDRTVATVVLSMDAKEAAKLLGGSVEEAGPALMGLQVDVEIPLAVSR